VGDGRDIGTPEVFAVAAGAAALAGGPHSAAGAPYPDRPIRLALPFPPGGVFDIVGRPWADKVKASLGSVFVDNQPGAGGSLAAQLVAHAPADGYTIFLGASSIHLTEMILREHPLLDPIKELTPISMVAITRFSIVVNPAVPVHTRQSRLSLRSTKPIIAPWRTRPIANRWWMRQ
jgi:tripartite-type tricarboxylate transporter receptor subunit TctC